jgi:hypothetical protein
METVVFPAVLPMAHALTAVLVPQIYLILLPAVVTLSGLLLARLLLVLQAERWWWVASLLL